MTTLRMYFWFRNLKERFVNDISGMGTVEVILILAVLVALALIFRNFIMDMATKIFGKIEDKTDGIIDQM